MTSNLADNIWQWPFALDLNENIGATFYVLLPQITGDVELSVLLQAGSGGTFIDLETLLFSIEVMEDVP